MLACAMTSVSQTRAQGSVANGAPQMPAPSARKYQGGRGP
jgi:hypothetical protein